MITKIVGIAGTNGSGKDTLGHMLRDEFGYTTVSLSDILREELTRHGLPHTRENLSGLSSEMRQAEGDGVMSRKVFRKYGTDRKLCITSIRAPGEAEEIQKVGGIIVWIDADQRVRYDRIQMANRGRGVTDELSFEEFKAQEAREMTPTTLGGGLNMAAVRDMADEKIANNFDSLKAYQDYLREYFKLSAS